MKLFLIEQDENDNFDTFDSAVVAALDEKTARYINPMEADSDWFSSCFGGKDWWKVKSTCVDVKPDYVSAWAKPKYVRATYLGEAKAGTKQGIICSSYNPG